MREASANTGGIRVYLGLGSNLEDRKTAMEKGLELLREEGFELQQVSSLYRTEPVGTDGPWFLNAVAAGSVQIGPLELLELCERIERTLGRRSKSDGAPRILDLDLLLYGDLCLANERLIVPHPRLAVRRFVLEPLAEVEPDLEIPGLGATVAALLLHCPDESGVERLADVS